MVTAGKGKRVNHMNKRRLLALLLSASMAITCAVAGAGTVFAASAGNPQGVYLKQETRGTCTLLSATMMLRQKSLNEGNPTWKNIIPKSVREYGWIEGVGIKSSFTYYGMTVKRTDIGGENNKSVIIKALKEHPEGVEIYDRNVPHAVMLTRYDEENDIFYCADPGLSDQEMKLGDSWMRKLFTGADQEDIINGVDSIYVITSYKMMDIPAYQGTTTEDEDDEEDVPSDNGDEDPGQAGSNDPGPVTPPAETEDPPVINTEPQTETKPVSEYFPEKKSYSSAGFKDIRDSEWYKPYVKKAYETGLMSGMSKDEFGPDGKVTIAQSVTIAARIYSICEGDGETFIASKGDDWYGPYVTYAWRHGIIVAKYTADSEMNKNATRAQFAEIISGALSDDVCKEINSISKNRFSDISESAGAEGRAVYRLCRAGIISGDDKGRFNPSASITRAEMAAVIGRVTDESIRTKL